jgi:hypothetical protein
VKESDKKEIAPAVDVPKQPETKKEEKKKPSIDADVDKLNHQMFFIMFFAILITNLVIWIYLGS